MPTDKGKIKHNMLVYDVWLKIFQNMVWIFHILIAFLEIYYHIFE